MLAPPKHAQNPLLVVEVGACMGKCVTETAPGCSASLFLSVIVGLECL